MIVVDSTVLIDHLRLQPAARAALRSGLRRPDRLHASVVSRTEILAGTRAEEAAVIDDLFAVVSWVDVTGPIADLAGRFKHAFGMSHSGIDVGDYLVAATAATLDAELWTLNVRHFPMFDGLSPPY